MKFYEKFVSAMPHCYIFLQNQEQIESTRGVDALRYQVAIVQL